MDSNTRENDWQGFLSFAEHESSVEMAELLHDKPNTAAAQMPCIRVHTIVPVVDAPHKLAVRVVSLTRAWTCHATTSIAGFLRVKAQRRLFLTG